MNYRKIQTTFIDDLHPHIKKAVLRRCRKALKYIGLSAQTIDTEIEIIKSERLCNVSDLLRVLND